ncbi:hypothetical protein FHX05_006214 [Rhizobium sp. BK491]|nr:hypothetical protein [Rhizobium sp. BK491]
MTSLLASQLSLNDIINYYLYGKDRAPDSYEDRLRPDAGSVAKFEVVASPDCHGCSERGSQALNLIRD